MQINVLRELRQRLGAVTTYEIRERSVHLSDIQLQDLAGVITLLRTDLGILVSVAASATIQQNCARCLKEANCPLDVDFAEEYTPVIDATTGERLHGDESEDQFRIGPDYLLDLREGLRQYVIISEPAKPLCRPDCAGLCPGCGADRNNTQCECTPETHERWGALSALRVNKNEGSLRRASTTQEENLNVTQAPSSGASLSVSP